jgi:hypothetical protein
LLVQGAAVLMLGGARSGRFRVGRFVFSATNPPTSISVAKMCTDFAFDKLAGLGRTDVRCRFCNVYDMDSCDLV